MTNSEQLRLGGILAKVCKRPEDVDVGSLVCDAVKSESRNHWRADGLCPTLVCNSKPYLFCQDRLLESRRLMALHGFDPFDIDLDNSLRFFRKLSGNAMSIPVIGACLLSVARLSVFSLPWGIAVPRTQMMMQTMAQRLRRILKMNLCASVVKKNLKLGHEFGPQ
ncbi:unnamed protein product [Durusdinium trenchii]|uniref:Uncharacterized protein n=1 Tax=Durusdinium trenchii TaxID=1381693 RepID=A0ABP0JSB1_9DINO